MKELLVGYCAVDSGQILMTDPCYLKDWKDDDWPNKKTKEGEYSYSGACNATMSKESAGQLKFKKGYTGAGVALSTGYGDGLYPVYVVKNKEGRIMRAIIKF